MATNRVCDEGLQGSLDDNGTAPSTAAALQLHDPREPRRPPEDERKPEGRSFTVRGVVVGLLIGIVVCFSNTYFGLQTGWVSSLSMPSALLGYSWFRLISRHLSFPFSPVENVLVQSVAGSVAVMPLGCGFVGVIPALNYLLDVEEGGPLRISTGNLIVWSLGIAFFGVVFAVPLRRQVIIREKLKFPSGTAAALIIGVLHGEKIHGLSEEPSSKTTEPDQGYQAVADEEPGTLVHSIRSDGEQQDRVDPAEWKSRMRLLLLAFGGASIYTVFSYFVPLNNVPVFGTYLAKEWLWTMNFSPAYVGQGVIMGTPTSLSMLLGAVVGYGILSPIARHKGWAPGDVDDWQNGSKGWIVWISLAIMLVDSFSSLAWLVLRPVVKQGPAVLAAIPGAFRTRNWKRLVLSSSHSQYQALGGDEPSAFISSAATVDDDSGGGDAPASQLISTKATLVGLLLSSVLCIASVQWVFSGLIHIGLTFLALLMAMLLSIMGVRALGETDLNPVSGISKLTQLMFGLLTPKNNKNAVIVNLVAGALSESGALQAGDLLQDLKAGHLLGASPAAQFWGQIIGCAVGAVVSAVVYELYTRVYTIPGELFEVPTAYVWIYTARLVTGQGLPPKVAEWALGSGGVFVALSALKIYLGAVPTRRRYAGWVPGGIAVAVGMYNSPSFTLARAVGGVLVWYWKTHKGRSETPIVVLASGLILGEGLFSIVNLILASFAVPHL